MDVIGKNVTDLYLAHQVRELDRIAIDDEGIAGIALMKAAARACVQVLLQRWPNVSRVAVICGAGNNAADGFIIAALLQDRGKHVEVVHLGAQPRPDTDASAAIGFMKEAQVPVVTMQSLHPDTELFVDAMLGTGLNREVSDNYKAAIDAINDSGLPVLAVDVPSGLSADTGDIFGAAVRATVTVTFIGRKVGLYTNNGPEHVGECCFDDLNVPAGIYQRVPVAARLISLDTSPGSRRPRHRNASKSDHGKLLIVGGDQGMAGAVTMAAESAFMSGAGMVAVATHPDNPHVVVTRRPEVMATGVTSVSDIAQRLAWADVVVMGPGMGQTAWSHMVFDEVLRSALPLVLDADGLNLLSRREAPLTAHLGGEGAKRSTWVLTPHPGEAGRLLGLSAQEVQADRLRASAQLQQVCGGVTLIKGAGTVIQQADQIQICPFGNPGMAVAGMGDVLSGVIGALLAGGLESLIATTRAVAIHARAADNIVARQGEIGLMATELLPEIRKLMNQA